MTTKELAELLRLKERKVYDLVSSGKIPCSRATGKLLFPRREIEAWIKYHASGSKRHASIERANVLLGSHDPLLEWAIRESRCGLASYLDSSLDGLRRFTNAEGIACGIHIYDADYNQWNRPIIEGKYSGQPVVLISWARRQRGIIVNQKYSPRVTQLNDLTGLKVVPRQKDAGSQVLLNALLDQHAIDHDSINWLNPARSEVDAVLAVQEGKADATLGLASLAAQYSLGFVPIIEECFDLLVDRRAWFESPWQTLHAFCQSDAFAQRANELAGYNIDPLFTVRFNGQ